MNPAHLSQELHFFTNRNSSNIQLFIEISYLVYGSLKQSLGGALDRISLVEKLDRTIRLRATHWGACFRHMFVFTRTPAEE